MFGVFCLALLLIIDFWYFFDNLCLIKALELALTQTQILSKAQKTRHHSQTHGRLHHLLQ